MRNKLSYYLDLWLKGEVNGTNSQPAKNKKGAGYFRKDLPIRRDTFLSKRI
jgi:hypothetical protein